MKTITPHPQQSILFVDHTAKFVRICAWCEQPQVDYECEHDWPQTKKYSARGYRCSHGICHYHELQAA